MQNMTQNKIKLFGGCLAYYTQRRPKHFLLLACEYAPGGGNSMGYPDEDGDCMTVGYTVELMYAAAVQVLIPHDIDPVIAVRQLKKLAEWLECEPWLIKESTADHMESERMESERMERERKPREEQWVF